MSEASLSSLFATNRCSCSRSKAFCLSRSTWAFVSLESRAVMTCDTDASVAEMIFGSRCKPCKYVFVSDAEPDASCCVVPAFSQAAFMASGASSPPVTSACVASTAAATFCSKAATLDSASRFTVAILRSAMPRFTSLIFFAAASSRVCSPVSSSVAAFAAPSERRLAASRFIAKKVFAPPVAVWAACPACSKAVMSLLASSIGMSSTPLRKGSSAAVTFSTASSASLTRSSDSLTMPSTTTRSVRSFRAATVAWSFLSASARRPRIFSISSLPRPCVRFWLSKKRPAVLSATVASAAWASHSFPPFLAASPSGCSGSASASSATRATFSSAATIFDVASSITRLAASRCSTLPQSFLYFATSADAPLSRVWYLISSWLTSVDISLPLDSICRAVMNFRASASAAFATFSAASASSHAARMSADDISRNFASSAKTPAASPTALARPSALATSDSASRIVAAFFRTAVAFFNSLSFLVCPSSSDWYAFSFSCASLLGPAVNRFASTNFVAMNIRAMETAVFAEVDEVSHALIAPSASSKGSSSTPMRKGPSASAALATVSSTDCNFSAASCRSDSHCTFSAFSLCWLFISARRCCEPLARSSSLASSSRGRPWTVAFFDAMNFSTAVTCSDALETACSACCIISLDTASPVLIIIVASSARSTSTSAGESLSRVSAMSFCAAVRWTKSCRTVFNGLSLLCACCSWVCNLPRSVAACCFTASLSRRRQLACFALR
mmetsp:Transcript_102600/g.313755  ORF Transcript_102600/g.313755 Transcript_102600/m.313755 type:complete len:734 (-) Transcript_102600:1197-3398(-)